MIIQFIRTLDHDGVTYEPGEVVKLPDHIALEIVEAGHARKHEAPAPTETTDDDAADDVEKS